MIYYKGKYQNYIKGGDLMKLFSRKKSYYTKEGYKQIFCPKSSEARSNGFAPEHRVKASQKIGRPIRGNEVVHHIDGNKHNNRIGNLKVMTRSQHCKLHNKNG